MLPIRAGRAFSSTALLLLGLLAPARALAVQTHGGIEGVVSHQLGHVLFVGGILFILLQGGTGRWNMPGWPSFRKFLYLILAWNLLTFIEHLMQHSPLADLVIRENGVATGFVLDSAAGAFYYLARLDHLVLVPAMYFLLRALRVWTSGPGEES